MNTPRDPDLIIADWLVDEAREGAPERLLAATRFRLESTRQRRAMWPARRYPEMTIPIRLALAAAAVLAVVAVGTRLLPGTPGPGGQSSPSPTPTASNAPSASLVPTLVADGTMPAGTYSMEPFGPPNSTTRIVFTVPNGFDYTAGWAIIPSDTRTVPPAGSGIGFLQPVGIFSDPCHWDVAGSASFPQPGDITVGPTADDLVNALAANPAYESSEPTAVIIGGYSGQRIDLQLPSDIDFAAACDKYVGMTEGSYFVWGTRHPGGSNLYAQGPGNRFHVSALDVRDGRIAVVVTDYAGTSREDQDRIQAILDSVQIQP